MPLQPKFGKRQSWLPNQVDYGIDCSDPDPANWKPFGHRVAEVEASAEKPKKSADSKASE